MDETGQEETRPESVHSDNGSEEGGFVEVTQEDAERASQSWEQQQQPQASVAAAEEDLDLYGDGDGAEGGDMEDEEKVRRLPHPVSHAEVGVLASLARPLGSWFVKTLSSPSQSLPSNLYIPPMLIV